MLTPLIGGQLEPISIEQIRENEQLIKNPSYPDFSLPKMPSIDQLHSTTRLAPLNKSPMIIQDDKEPTNIASPKRKMLPRKVPHHLPKMEK
jgi:hypothetical protein